MGRTGIRSGQIFDGGVKKDDINVSESGQALITKLIAGANVTIDSSTGADTGTGDVTISAAGGGGGGGTTGTPVEAVRVATTGIIADLSDASVTIDNITCVQGDRVLVKDEASADGIEGVDAKRNGVYIVGIVTTGTAPFTRAVDMNESGETKAGLSLFVSEGSVNGNNNFQLTTDNPIILGTTGLIFAEFAGTGVVGGNAFLDDGNGGLMPNNDFTSSVVWELDGNDDLQPQA